MKIMKIEVKQLLKYETLKTVGAIYNEKNDFPRNLFCD